MKSSLFVASFTSLFSLSYAYTYGLGTSWSIGTGSTSKIVKVTTTLNAGTPPSGQEGELVLWAGLSNGTGDLLLTSLESWTDQSWCDGNLTEWCIRTSVFSNRRSTDGNYAPAPANQPVTFVFEQNANKSGWTQTASINGKGVSQLYFPSGDMTLFGVTTQCDDYCAMTVSTQTYSNTTIELESADLSWGSTAQPGTHIYGDGTIDTTTQKPTTIQGFTSSQSGKIWTVSEIVIPPL